jgi:hypothetical protein
MGGGRYSRCLGDLLQRLRVPLRAQCGGMLLAAGDPHGGVARAIEVGSKSVSGDRNRLCAPTGAGSDFAVTSIDPNADPYTVG